MTFICMHFASHSHLGQGQACGHDVLTIIASFCVTVTGSAVTPGTNCSVRALWFTQLLKAIRKAAASETSQQRSQSPLCRRTRCS